jgi:hypothetical protein
MQTATEALKKHSKCQPPQRGEIVRQLGKLRKIKKHSVN